MEEDWHEQRKGNASAMVTVIREGSTREANLILEVVGVVGGGCKTGEGAGVLFIRQCRSTEGLFNGSGMVRFPT